MMTIPKGYKQAEIGMIPEDWEVKQLEEIANISMGQSPIGSSYNKTENGVPLINGPTEFTERFPIKKQWTTDPTKLCKSGDILICVRGSSTGRLNISNDEYCIGRGVAALWSRQNYDNILLEYLTSNSITKILSLTSGSTFPNIDGGTLRSIKVPIPAKLSEQTAIATALSDTDALISSMEKLIAKKRSIKQGAMQVLLRAKEGWEVKKLGDLLKIRHGKSQNGIESKDGDYPILGTGGLMGFSNHYLYNKPSVLIGRKGTIDKPQFMDSPFWTVDTLFYSEINEGVSPKFIFYRFQLIDWYSHNEASGVPSLNAKTIEKIEIGTPNFSEQTRIATILSDMDAEIAALETKLTKYRQVKQGMMQQLLTGKIRLVSL